MTPEQANRIINGLKRLGAKSPYPWRYRIKWDVLYASLLDDDPEALALVAELPERVRQDRTQARQEAQEARRAAAWESQALDLEDASYKGPRALARAARGKLVWLYHGTSSAVVPAILAQGLIPDPAVRAGSESSRRVFLTARPGSWSETGGTAYFYAQRATAAHGGEPVVLRVIVPFDSLEFDPDDEDIESGNYQFATSYVPPEAIKEINGERRS